MSESKNYVRTDENGVMRVGASQVMLDSIVAAFEQGYSPETIQQQYPALCLEEVYGCIAYYLANSEAVNGYLQRQDALWKEWRTRCNNPPSPLVKRLQALRRTGNKEAS